MFPTNLGIQYKLKLTWPFYTRSCLSTLSPCPTATVVWRAPVYRVIQPGGNLVHYRGSPMTSVADARCLESIRRARQTDKHMFCGHSRHRGHTAGWGWDTTITARLASDGSWHTETVNLFSSSWQKRFDLWVARSGSYKAVQMCLVKILLRT